jgi:Flp pilus assembly protein TadD
MGLGQTYVQMGRYEEAIAALDEAAALAGDVNWVKEVRGWALGLAGRVDEAQRLLGELEKAGTRQKVDPGAFAYVHMGLGDRDRAIAWLRQAYEERSADMVFLRTPTWDSLRSEPEFIELMNDVGLPTG